MLSEFDLGKGLGLKNLASRGRGETAPHMKNRHYSKKDYYFWQPSKQTEFLSMTVKKVGKERVKLDREKKKKRIISGKRVT